MLRFPRVRATPPLFKKFTRRDVPSSQTSQPPTHPQSVSGSPQDVTPIWMPFQRFSALPQPGDP